jgi:hypothetical protein
LDTHNCFKLKCLLIIPGRCLKWHESVLSNFGVFFIEKTSTFRPFIFLIIYDDRKPFLSNELTTTRKCRRLSDIMAYYYYHFRFNILMEINMITSMDKEEKLMIQRSPEDWGSI